MEEKKVIDEMKIIFTYKTIFFHRFVLYFFATFQELFSLFLLNITSTRVLHYNDIWLYRRAFKNWAIIELDSVLWCGWNEIVHFSRLYVSAPRVFWNVCSRKDVFFLMLLASFPTWNEKEMDLELLRSSTSKWMSNFALSILLCACVIGF